MGDTFAPSEEGHAVEGVSPHGRAASVCGAPARGRENGAAVCRVRDLAEDRLQDLRPVQVHAVLDRHGLVRRRRRRRHAATGTELSRPMAPNALWCADYKGEFMLGNRQYCYPLTITDFASRYLLTCEALSTTQEKFDLHGVRAHVQGVWAALR